MTDEQETELYTADCGHEVPKSETVSVPEVVLCERCYEPFSLDSWPEIIGTHEYRAIEARGTTKVVNRVKLIGLDQRGRAVYYDGDDRRFKTYVPMHDRAYRDDRHERAQQVAEWRHVHEHDGVLTPQRESNSKPDPAPSYPGNFVTLPNGDHIVMVEVTDKVQSREVGNWLEDHADEFKQVRPKLVEYHGLSDLFDPEDGRPKDRE